MYEQHLVGFDLKWKVKVNHMLVSQEDRMKPGFMSKLHLSRLSFLHV